MGMITGEDGKRINPNATKRIIRDDYHKKPLISYAEAADMSGVDIKAVYKWTRTGKIPIERKVGPYRLSSEKVQKFLRTGVAVS